MMGNLGSVLNAIVAPAESCLARVSGSLVMVLLLGFGIRPLGPRTLAYLASLGMSAGVARRTSKLNSLLFRAVMVLSEKISTRIVLPVEKGTLTSPRRPVSRTLRWRSMLLLPWGGEMSFSRASWGE